MPSRSLRTTRSACSQMDLYTLLDTKMPFAWRIMMDILGRLLLDSVRILPYFLSIRQSSQYQRTSTGRCRGLMDGGSTDWRSALLACSIGSSNWDAKSLGPKDGAHESSPASLPSASAGKFNLRNMRSGTNAMYLGVCLEQKWCLVQPEALRDPLQGIWQAC